MAVIIGIFKKADDNLEGEIVMISLQAKNVRIVAEASAQSENASTHQPAGSLLVVLKSVPDGPNVQGKAATLSRSNSTTRALAMRSTPACLLMTTARPII